MLQVSTLRSLYSHVTTSLSSPSPLPAGEGVLCGEAVSGDGEPGEEEKLSVSGGPSVPTSVIPSSHLLFLFSSFIIPHSLSPPPYPHLHNHCYCYSSSSFSICIYSYVHLLCTLPLLLLYIHYSVQYAVEVLKCLSCCLQELIQYVVKNSCT